MGFGRLGVPMIAGVGRAGFSEGVGGDDLALGLIEPSAQITAWLVVYL